MKLKGISFWEQNVEKIFLGVVGVGVLGALGYQYVLQNTAVQVGKDMVPPEKSFDPVAKAARELKGKLEATDPKLPEIPDANVADRFAALVAGSVVPVKSYPAFGSALKLDTGSVVEATGDRLFAEVAVPSPSGAMAHAFRSTVSPFEVAAHPDVKAILPAEQPFDKAAASVEAVFDGTALKAAFEADPDGSGPIGPLLPSWWRETDIIGVELERQVQNSDGGWSEGTVVPAMPGRVDLLGEVKKRVKSVGDLPVVLAVARQAPDQVQRPPYYQTVSGVEWKPPIELAEAGAGADVPKDERSRLLARITDLENRYRKVEAQIAAQAEQKNRQQAKGAERPAASPGRMAKGGGASPAQSSSSTNADPRTPAEKARDGLVLQIDRARKDLEAFDAKAAGAAPAATGAASGQPVLGADGKPITPPLFENPKVRVWTHDVSVEAGKTYRYRLRVAVTNPLFGRQASLKPEQAALAQDAVLRSEWSDWTDPVTVDPNEYYFVTSASERDVTGPTRASAELFKFYYGYYRRGSVTVEPGDVLAAEMKIPDGLKIYDMTKLAMIVPQAPTAAAPDPGAPRDEGGGGRGRRVIRANDEGRGASEAGQPAVEAPPAQVASQPPADGSWKPAPKSMKMAVDAMLLDVGPVAIAQDTKLGVKSDAKTQAFLRVADGAIQVRLPATDTSDPAYGRLKRNAEAGEKAAKAGEQPIQQPLKLPPPPVAPPPGSTRPPPPGGGGGGG